MKYKKGLLIICLIICLFSVASVCASEVNETDLSSDGQTEDIISTGDNTDKIGKIGNDELCTAPETFAILNNNIVDLNVNETDNINYQIDMIEPISTSKNTVTINFEEITYAGVDPYGSKYFEYTNKATATKKLCGIGKTTNLSSITLTLEKNSKYSYRCYNLNVAGPSANPYGYSTGSTYEQDIFTGSFSTDNNGHITNFNSTQNKIVNLSINKGTVRWADITKYSSSITRHSIQLNEGGNNITISQYGRKYMININYHVIGKTLDSIIKLENPDKIINHNNNKGLIYDYTINIEKEQYKTPVYKIVKNPKKVLYKWGKGPKHTKTFKFITYDYSKRKAIKFIKWRFRVNSIECCDKATARAVNFYEWVSGWNFDTEMDNCYSYKYKLSLKRISGKMPQNTQAAGCYKFKCTVKFIYYGWKPIYKTKIVNKKVVDHYTTHYKDVKVLHIY